MIIYDINFYLKKIFLYILRLLNANKRKHCCLHHTYKKTNKITLSSRSLKKDAKRSFHLLLRYLPNIQLNPEQAKFFLHLHKIFRKLKYF